MPEFDDKALDKFIDEKLNPPVRRPANRRVIVDKLLNVARNVRATRLSKGRKA